MKFHIFAAAFALVGAQCLGTARAVPIGTPLLENLGDLDQFDFSASSRSIDNCFTDPLLGVLKDRHPGDASDDRRPVCGGLGGGAGGLGGDGNMLLGPNPDFNYFAAYLTNLANGSSGAEGSSSSATDGPDPNCSPCRPNHDFVPVPGPIVGAGLPGLMLTGAALFGWFRRKQKAEVVI